MTPKIATRPSGFRIFFEILTPIGTLGFAGSAYHSGWSPCASTVTTPVPATPSGSYSDAAGNPVALSCLTRALPAATMSVLVPNCRHPVGHAFTHAGSRPTLVRSTHIVHLAILPVDASHRATSHTPPVD